MDNRLSPAEEAEARALYAEFFSLNPDQKNPTDLNTEEKARFFFEGGWRQGWQRLTLMQAARKGGYDFT